MLGRFEAAAAAEATFAGRIRAVLDDSVALNRDDPSLAAFVSVSTIEVRRHPELGTDAAAVGAATYGFFDRLAREADAAGELAPGVDPGHVAGMLVAASMGLALFAAAAGDDALQAAVTAAFARLVDGTLLASMRPRSRPPPTGRGGSPRRGR